MKQALVTDVYLCDSLVVGYWQQIANTWYSFSY